MSAKLSLRMDLRLDELTRVAAALEEFARAEDWSSEVEYQIKLAVEELGINIINYSDGEGAGAEPRHAEIEIASDADEVVVRIADDGRPFDPFAEAPAPDLESGIDIRPIGGLGVHLVKTMMNEARYRREDGRNQVTLVKRRTG